MTICCPISGADGDSGPSFSVTEIRRAARPHVCGECGDVIVKGARYEHTSGCWDGDMGRYKTCLSCREIRDHFACDGFYYGQLWEDLEGNLFPEMTCGGACLEGLSPENKNRLIDKRLAWLYAGGEATWQRTYKATRELTPEMAEKVKEADLEARNVELARQDEYERYWGDRCGR